MGFTRTPTAPGGGDGEPDRAKGKLAAQTRLALLLWLADARYTGAMPSHPTLDRVLEEARETLEAYEADPDQRRVFEEFVGLCIETLSSGGKLLACGNGGSLCDAMHFAQECAGRLFRDRPALSAIAFSDPAQLTAIANDYGFEQVFARQLEAHGRSGDLLVAISTSGNSENLVQAVESARHRGIRSVGLLGRGGGKLLERVDLAMVVPHAVRPDRIQEMHIKILHAAVEAVEARLYPELETDAR